MVFLPLYLLNLFIKIIMILNSFTKLFIKFICQAIIKNQQHKLN